MASTLWNKAAYQRRAAAIRELKKWIILPKKDTRPHFTDKLEAIVGLVSSGNWDGLPAADPGTGIPWWKTVLSVMRSLAITLAPLLVVYLPKWNRWLLDEDVIYIRSAWIWAILSLLFILDPRFGDKVSAIKDILPGRRS
jgi:hypothetical protein